MFSYYSRDNNEQVKSLCNVVRQAPDNTASEEIFCNVVLILLEQHCTAENYMQCCPRGSTQICIREDPVQHFLNTFGTH